MKRFLAVTLILAVVLMAGNLYAARVIELDKFKVENAIIVKVNVQVDTGEVDGEGQPIMIDEQKLALVINFTLVNDEGNQLGDKKVFILNDTKRTQAKNFLNPFIDDIKNEEGLTEIE